MSFADSPPANKQLDKLMRAVRRGESAHFDLDPMGDLLRDETTTALPQWFSTRKGWVYLAVNASWPGVCKVGCTRVSPDQRLQQLSGTAVATPWELAFAWRVYDAHGLEAYCHRELKDAHLKAELFAGEALALSQRVHRAMLSDRSALYQGLHQLLLPGELESLLLIEAWTGGPVEAAKSNGVPIPRQETTF